MLKACHQSVSVAVGLALWCNSPHKAHMSEERPPTRVVVIGGGGGCSNLLHSLNPLCRAGLVDSLHGIITTSDDGGSTGALRRAYGGSAWGDIGKNILALADSEEHHKVLSILNHRFNGGALDGHTVRNVVMAALHAQQQNHGRTGADSQVQLAINALAHTLGVPPKMGVVPVTEHPSKMVLVTEEGAVLAEGQSNVCSLPVIRPQCHVQLQATDDNDCSSDVDADNDGNQTGPYLSKQASEILHQATHVLVAPGNVWGSILPALASPGLADALKGKKLVYIMPFFNRTDVEHTRGWSVEHHVAQYNRYLNRRPDVVLVNSLFTAGVAEDHEWLDVGGTVSVTGEKCSTSRGPAVSAHASELELIPLEGSELLSVPLASKQKTAAVPGRARVWCPIFPCLTY